MQLIKPLYGLCESGDLWHATLDAYHREELGMKPLRSDSALYTYKMNGLLTELSGSYVDDLIRAGDQGFRKMSKRTCERFEMADDESPPCTFTGFRLEIGESSSLSIDKHSYVKGILPLRLDARFSDFTSLRMKLAWLTHTRRDCSYEVSQMAQVTRERFDLEPSKVIKNCNRMVKHVRMHRLLIQVPKLDISSLRIVGFSDASFASNSDLTSQLGYVCFLSDATEAVTIIAFKSYKARRVTRSVIAAEVVSFSEMFDCCFTLAEDLRSIMQVKFIPVQLYTDSESQFDVIYKGTRTAEKRLMLDMAVAKEGFRKKEISDIGFVRSNDNVADGLTKTMHQKALMDVLQT